MTFDRNQKPEIKPALLISDDSLFELQRRPSLRKYVRQVWASRHFIAAEAKGKAFNTGRGTFLGKIWLLLDPLLQVVIYAVVFGLVLQTSRGIDNFIGFLVIGVVYFRFLTQGIAAGSGLIQKSRPLISSFDFPRASLTFSVNFKNFVDNLIPAALSVVGAVLFQLNESVHWTILFVIPLYLLICVFCTGATLIVARATALLPDLKTVVTVINRGLFFVSGVFFDVERFATQPVLQELMVANPIYQFLSALRLCVLDGQIPSFSTWGYLILWSFGLFIIGFFYFWQAEEKYTSVK